MRHSIELFKLLPNGDDGRVCRLGEITETLCFDVVLQRGIEMFMPEHDVQNPMMDDTCQQCGKTIAQIMNRRVRQVGTFE
jgi:hypothetical protein